MSKKHARMINHNMERAITPQGPVFKFDTVDFNNNYDHPEHM